MVHRTTSFRWRAWLMVVVIVLGACALPMDDSREAGIDAAGLSRKWSTTGCQRSGGEGIDLDGDDILDECEFDVAYAFRPSLVFHPEEDAKSRETYWAVRQPTKTSSSLRIFYALGYHRDTGIDALGGAFGHDGDSEAIVVSVTPRVGRWTTDTVLISAHGNFRSPPIDSLTWVGMELPRYDGHLFLWANEGG
ncbi:MAG: hypothetical protein OXN18_06285, partial [Gemmatimonadota bacterium]|nr:hypothetical protein [Gemmatimonadota bacterium]